MIHHLKILPQYFQAIVQGEKPFELRREDDRRFARGDVLVLREVNPEWFEMAEATHDETMVYTGRSVEVVVVGEPVRDTTWLQPGVAALGIRVLRVFPAGEAAS